MSDATERWKVFCKENPKIPVHVFWQMEAEKLQAQVDRANTYNAHLIKVRGILQAQVDELEAHKKANRKNLLVYAASCAKAQQGLYNDEEHPFTKAELREKLSFAASFIATMSMDLRHAALQEGG